MSLGPLLLALSLSSPVHAKRDPCKKAVSSAEDPFGSSITAGVVYLDIGGFTALGITRKDGVTTLEVLWVVDDSIAAGNPTLIALEGGTVLELPAREDAAPISNANTSAVFTQWIVRHDLTDEHLAAFAQSPTVAVKTQGPTGEWQLGVADKKAEKFKTVAGCMREL